MKKTVCRFTRYMLLALMGVTLLLSVAFAQSGDTQHPAALFMNVGKADSAVFWVGGKTYLVDTGSKDSTDAMLRALQIHDVTHLDGVFITHTDKDHVGGLKELLKSNISVDKLYTPRFHAEKSDDKHPVYGASQSYGVPMEWLSAGDVIEADADHRFVVLGPLSQAANDNDNSLVMDLQTPHGNILLTGDMEFPEETELLNANVIPQATVLKVSHHGEDDTSSRLFLARVKPQWAVISTSTAEEKDTPSPKVVALLWDVKADVAVTQDATCGIYVTLQDGDATAQLINYTE